MAYPCTKASWGGSVFQSVDDRSVVSGRSTSSAGTGRVSDNTSKDAGTVRNYGSTGVLKSKGGRDASGSTIQSGY
jgi:hypothetical protein